MQSTNESNTLGIAALAGESLAGRSFNVRISFDANGLPVVGWVHGLYDMSEGVTEIKRIPEAEHLSIAEALGIKASSVHHSVNRALRAKEAVSC